MTGITSEFSIQSLTLVNLFVMEISTLRHIAKKLRLIWVHMANMNERVNLSKYPYFFSTPKTTSAHPSADPKPQVKVSHSQIASRIIGHTRQAEMHTHIQTRTHPEAHQKHIRIRALIL